LRLLVVVLVMCLTACGVMLREARDAKRPLFAGLTPSTTDNCVLYIYAPTPDRMYVDLVMDGDGVLEYRRWLDRASRLEPDNESIKKLLVSNFQYGYVRREIPCGEHRFRVVTRCTVRCLGTNFFVKASTSMTLNHGTTSFLRIHVFEAPVPATINLVGAKRSNWVLTMPNEADALDELRKTRYFDSEQ